MLGLADRALLYVIVIFGALLGFFAPFPFLSTLIKYRANYTPKRIELDSEETQRHSPTGVGSYFAMLRRVKRVEGMAGYFKGFMPNALFSILLLSVGVLFRDELTSSTALAGVSWYRFTAELLGEIIALPIKVIIFRAITTPYRLPWYNPVFSLRMLLSGTERRYPWLLFLTPGLLISIILSVVHGTLVMGVLLSPILRLATHPLGRSSPANISIYAVASLLSVLAKSPLEVATVRLLIQRNHLPREYEMIAQEGQAESSGAIYSGADEDVVNLRSEGDPYNGFFDCIRRIKNEEGYSTLFRAWWIDLITLWYVTLALPWLLS